MNKREFLKTTGLTTLGLTMCPSIVKGLIPETIDIEYIYKNVIPKLDNCENKYLVGEFYGYVNACNYPLNYITWFGLDENKIDYFRNIEKLNFSTNDNTFTCRDGKNPLEFKGWRRIAGYKRSNQINIFFNKTDWEGHKQILKTFGINDIINKMYYDL